MIWKILGVGAAFGLGYLVFRPKKVAATVSEQPVVTGCFDQDTVQAWGVQEDLSLILVQSKEALALLSWNAGIEAIVVGDVCEVFVRNETRRNYDFSEARTDSLTRFISIHMTNTVGGIQWLAA